MDPKTKINKVVKGYKDLFPEEYAAFLSAMKTKRAQTLDEFASIKGDHIFERLLFEVPETLHVALYQQLTDEEFKYYDSKEGSRWFAKEHPEFVVARKT